MSEMFDPDAGLQEQRYWGKYKAFVRRNDDPEARGRLVCYCPDIMGDAEDCETSWFDWATPCLPWIGGVNTLDSGSPLTKEQNGGVEVGVWLEFERGMLDFPIWVGTYIPAETRTDPGAQQDIDAVTYPSVGDIASNPPAGSKVGPINPIRPDQSTPELRLMVKADRDILIMSDRGGSILVGPSGVHINGAQVTINGRRMLSDRAGHVSG